MYGTGHYNFRRAIASLQGTCAWCLGCPPPGWELCPWARRHGSLPWAFLPRSLAATPLVRALRPAGRPLRRACSDAASYILRPCGQEAGHERRLTFGRAWVGIDFFSYTCSRKDHLSAFNLILGNCLRKLAVGRAAGTFFHGVGGFGVPEFATYHGLA